MLETHDVNTQKRWVANPMMESFIQKFHRMMASGESYYGNTTIKPKLKPKPTPTPDPDTSSSDTESEIPPLFPDSDDDDITGGLFD